MAKYLQAGNKYYTVGQGSQLQEVSPEDIVAVTGDKSVSIEQQRARGEIATYDPSQHQLTSDPSLGGGYYLTEGGKPVALGGSAIVIKNQAEAQALGLSSPAGLPAGQVALDTSFQDYLKQSGQTYTPTTGFSGGSSQPFQTQQQATQLTPAQSTNANNTVSKQWNAQRNSWDVFKSDGTPITETQFKSMGLNIDHINTQQVLKSRTPGQVEAEKTLGAGATSTGMLGSEQSDFFKMVKDRFAKADELQAQLLTSMERSAEEKKLKGTINEVTNSFEAGLRDINGQNIPMQLIIGQGAELEKMATDKVKTLQRLLDTYKDDREEKTKILEKAYDISRNSTNDMIALYKLTQDDKLWTDTDNGKVYFQNPFTGVISSKELPGFTKKPAEGTETTSYSKALQKGIDDLYSGNFGTQGAREKLISKLQAMFPGTSASKDVYNRIKDGYEKNIIGTTKKDLTTEETGIINDAKAAIDQVRQRFGDVVNTRQQIIDRVKQTNGFDISPYL